MAACAHHVEDAGQGHVVGSCSGAHRLEQVDECLVIDELASQVMPPRAVDSGPAENLLHAAVVYGDQVRALACQELPRCDGADSVPFGERLDVTDNGPQFRGGAVICDVGVGFGVLQRDASRDLGEQVVSSRA
jgi:hypothetical protein